MCIPIRIFQLGYSRPSGLSSLYLWQKFIYGHLKITRKHMQFLSFLGQKVQIQVIKESKLYLF